MTKVLAKEMQNRGHRVIFIAPITQEEKARNARLLESLGMNQDTYPYVAPQYYVDAGMELELVVTETTEILEQNKIDIDVLNVETTNSENMKEAIIKYKPDIVLTNEMKKDKPATDIIKEIQDDITQFQPIFIIHTGYHTFLSGYGCHFSCVGWGYSLYQ